LHNRDGLLTNGKNIDVYGHGKNIQKSQKYAAMVHRAPNTLTVIDKKKHGKKRRVISQAFSDNTLKSYESVILEQVQHLCNALRKGSDGQPVPIHSWSPAKDIGHLSMLPDPTAFRFNG
jgi:cytochrome P450